MNFCKIPPQDYGVSCPRVSEKAMYNVVNTLAPLFLIESSSFLQVTRTNIKSGLSSKFSLIQSCTAELGALEHLKKSPSTCNGRNLVATLASSFIAHLSQRLTRWAYSIPIEPAYVYLFTLSNMNISATSRPITNFI